MHTKKQRTVTGKRVITQSKRPLVGKNSHPITHKKTLNPLGVFLSKCSDDGNDCRLSRIAQNAHAETADIARFRAELINKLNRLRYPQPPEGHAHQLKKTFYQRLKTAGALRTLLHSSTLNDISRCLLIRTIAREDHHLADERLSIKRYPLRLHANLAREMERHLEHVTSLAQKHNVPQSYLQPYCDLIYTRAMNELRILALSRWPGSRKELLSGRRDEQLAADEAIFSRLQINLARHAFSSRFLRQLSQLISAPADVKELSSDLSLYRAIVRRMHKTSRSGRQ